MLSMLRFNSLPASGTLLLPANYLCKQFDSRSGLTKQNSEPDQGPNSFAH